MKQTPQVRRADALFRHHITSRGYCELATWTDVGPCMGRLECAHVFTRDYGAIRWEDENAICACLYHHAWGHRNPKAWLRTVRWMGRDVDALYAKALTLQPMDPEEAIARLEAV